MAMAPAVRWRASCVDRLGGLGLAGGGADLVLGGGLGGGDLGGAGAGVPGGEVDERGLDAGGEQQRGAGRQGADRGGLEDVLAAQRHRFAGPAVAVVDGADGDVVLADQRGQVAGQAGGVGAGADDFLGGGAPQGGHPGLAPHGDALLVGLQDGDRGDAAGPEVGVQVGQVGDPADVGGLVQHHHQRRVQPPPGPLGPAFGGPHRGVGQRGDQRRGRRPGFGQQVQGAARWRRTRPGSNMGRVPWRGGVTQAMMAGSVMALAAVRAVW